MQDRKEGASRQFGLGDLAADIARRSPDQTVERIMQCAGMYPFEKFVIETNNIQDLLVGNLSRSSIAAG